LEPCVDGVSAAHVTSIPSAVPDIPVGTQRLSIDCIGRLMPFFHRIAITRHVNTIVGRDTVIDTVRLRPMRPSFGRWAHAQRLTAFYPSARAFDIP
ncbi:MAG: hypothetical protein WBR17_07180, partial [Paraburkholderia sp.]|uniref:hypothetical protein n=1 Tax=Paraburkholderia sp. TaxID=1926495 RepID=UPI003C683775